jgi:hypothetical protein
MHEHAGLGDIIGMIILHLEVINLDRVFQQLMLDFFNNDILAVDEYQNIPSAQVHRVCPAFDRAIERVRRRCNNLLAVYKDMH